MTDDGQLPLEAYLTALCSLDDLGPGRLRWMLRLGTPEEVWERVRSARLPVPPPRVAPAAITAAWAQQSAGIDPSRVWERCGRLGVGVVALGGPGYPPSLVDDVDPPVVLFHLGDPDRISSPRVGIVGTRRATGYGLQVAREFGRALAAAGASVVSGLALGIDAAAHDGALAGGPDHAAPIAVVAAGLDAPCPRRNRPLAGRVADAGVVFSEVPPGVSAAPWRFPVRNRVIAALSDVVVVVESPGAGGSMVTVREAMERDRPVLSVPGPIHSRASEGTNRLIGDGALVAAGVDDVLMALGLDASERGRSGTPRTAPLDARAAPRGDAEAVLEAIGWRPSSIDQLALRCGLDFRGISRALAELESAGWIQRTDGWIERVARG